MKFFFAILLTYTLLISDDCLESKKRYGYSYLAIGLQHTNYAQTFKAKDGDYKLHSTSNSSYYTTATLTRINSSYGFEIYAASTLLANTTKETLSYNDNYKIEHPLDLSLTDIALTFHYKPYNEHHRLVFGGRYTYEVLKRYNFSTVKTSSSSTIIENKIAALTADIGYLYMSRIETGVQGLNYRVGATFGIPFFTARADSYNNNSFNPNSAWGYKLSANLYIGYTVYDGLELGTYFDTLLQVRYDNIEGTDAQGNNTTAKESYKTLRNIGLMASWSF